jgi:hypothetical protein
MLQFTKQLFLGRETRSLKALISPQTKWLENPLGKAALFTL